MSRTHTYYVVADDLSVLVHNVGGDCLVHGPSALPGTNPKRCTCRGSEESDAAETAIENKEAITEAINRPDQSGRIANSVVKSIEDSPDPVTGTVLAVTIAGAAVARRARWLLG